MTFNQKFMPPFNLTPLWKTYYLEASQLLICLFPNIIKAYRVIKIIINLLVGNRHPTFKN